MRTGWADAPEARWIWKGWRETAAKLLASGDEGAGGLSLPSTGVIVTALGVLVVVSGTAAAPLIYSIF